MVERDWTVSLPVGGTRVIVRAQDEEPDDVQLGETDAGAAGGCVRRSRRVAGRVHRAGKNKKKKKKKKKKNVLSPFVLTPPPPPATACDV